MYRFAAVNAYIHVLVIDELKQNNGFKVRLTCKADGSCKVQSINWLILQLPWKLYKWAYGKPIFLVVGDSCWWLLRGLFGPVSCQWLSYPSHVFPSFRDFLLWRLRFGHHSDGFYFDWGWLHKDSTYVCKYLLYACMSIYICIYIYMFYMYIDYIYIHIRICILNTYSYVLMFIHW